MQPLWFDAVIAVILIVATLRGAIKGLVWQLAWISAIVLSFAFSEFASVTVAGAIPVEAPMNRWLAMLGLYIVASFVSFAIAIRLRDWIEKIKFKDFDRHLGAIFGFVKGTALSLVVIFFSVTLSKSIRETALQSHSGYGAAIVMQEWHPVMPEELHDILHSYIHKLDDVNGVDVHADDPDEKSGKGGAAKSAPKGKLPASGSPGPFSAAENERRELMSRIAAVYAEVPAKRLKIVEEMEVRLGGIAEKAAMGLLRDWDADLHPGTRDPDPATTWQTKFAARLKHHVEAAAKRISATGSSNPTR